MAHISIAVLIVTRSTEEHNDTSRKFLVLEENSGHKFWEFKNNALNAQFRRDVFENKLYSFLNLNNEVQGDFKPLGDQPYRNRSEPGRTAYQVTLVDNSGDLSEEISSHLLSKNDHFKWCSYNELISLEDSWLDYQKFIFEDSRDGFRSPDPVAFENDFLSIVERIQDAQIGGRLVVLVGAGVSVNSGIPEWKNIVAAIKAETKIPEHETDFTIIAQLLYNNRGKSEYFNFLDKLLNKKGIKRNPIHEELLKLEPYHIVTTNFDRLIEQADQNRFAEFGVVNKDSDFPKILNPRLIIKMHGDIEDRNIVFREDDYLNYTANFPLIERFIQGIFASKLVLMIGFSFSDINLKFILERVRSVLKKEALRPILFLPSHEENLAMDKYYASRGVDVVHYNSLINKYIRQNNLRRQETRDERGNMLLKFLYFLRKYDRNTETIRNKEIIEQLYNARLRFAQYRVAPSASIIKVRPFAISSNRRGWADYESMGFHLKTKNEYIIDLLKKYKGRDGDKINLNDRADLTIESRRKLLDVFEWLMSSGVRCIQLRDSFAVENHYRIDISEKKSECKCPACSLGRFQILNSLHTANILTKSARPYKEDSWVMMGVAFSKALYGDYLETYTILKEVVVASKISGNLIQYVIALYNIKTLYPYLKELATSVDVTQEYKESLLEEIEEIDIASTISSLPLEKIDKEALRSLTQGRDRQLLEWKIEDLVKKIEKVLRIYDNGGYSSGPNYIDELTSSVFEFYNFHHGNYVVNLIRGEFQVIVRKMFRAAILMHLVSEDYTARLDSFDWFYYKLVIVYCNADGLYEIIKDKLPCQLSLHKNQHQDFISAFCNLLDSTWDKDLFGRITVPQELKIQMDRSLWFNQRIRHWVANSVLLMGCTEIEPNIDDKKRIVEGLLNYLDLDHQRFEQKQVFVFIRKKLKWFTEDQIDRMLPLICTGNWTRAISTDAVVAVVISTFPDYRFKGARKFNILRKKVQEYGEMSTIIELFPICSEEIKNEIKGIVIDYLMKTPWSEDITRDYLDAVHNRIFHLTSNRFLEKFITHWGEKVKAGDAVRKGNVHFVEPGLAWGFIDVLHMNEFRWPKVLTNLLKDENTSLFMKWALNPWEFNYKYFDSGWLIAVKDTTMVGALKQKPVSQLKAKVKKDLFTNYSKELFEVMSELSV